MKSKGGSQTLDQFIDQNVKQTYLNPMGVYAEMKSLTYGADGDTL